MISFYCSLLLEMNLKRLLTGALLAKQTKLNFHKIELTFTHKKAS